MSKIFRISIGLVISFVFLAMAARGFDFGVLVTELRNASYIWFLPAIAIYVLNMTLRSLRWRTLLSPQKQIPMKTVIPTLIVGFFMNAILPARAGEFIRAFSMARKTNLPSGSVLGSVVLERLTDFCGLALVIAIASRLLPWDKLPIVPIVSIVVAGVIACSTMFFVQRRLKNRALSSSSILNKIQTLFLQVTSGFSALRSFSKVSLVMLLSWTVWINELLMPFFISRAMHLNLTFFESGGLLTGLSFGVMIPAAPGFIGTYEFFGKTVLEMLGKPGSQALGYVVVLHFFHLSMVTLLALFCFLYESSFRSESVPKGEPQTT